MKIGIVTLILVFLSASLIMAQELPEPTGVPIGTYTYRVEICWGTLVANSAWKNVESFSTSVVDGIVGVHNYGSKLGNQIWESNITVDPLVPKKLIINFSIGVGDIPVDNFNYHFYRTRIISWLSNSMGIAITDEQTSLASYWTAIYKTTPPGQLKKK